MLACVAPITLGSVAARAESFSVLHSFTGPPDGDMPYAALINVGGTLYGTTYEGGANNDGSVFTITPAGAENVIYSFTSQRGDGEMPYAPLINVDGTLYGTTSEGGRGGCGTVFSVTPAGAETVLYSFKCSDGANPRGGLLNVGGTLYGTTENGGSHNLGTVFKVTLTGTETVVHSFGATGDGTSPLAALIKVGGKLYGTAYEGGANGLGAVFTISRTGKEKVLYSFQNSNDANNPVAPLLDVGGTLYGTSEYGGGYSCDKGFYTCGAVFKITPSGHEKVLYSFYGKPDGEYPTGGLINANGTLYGTTASGGSGKDCVNVCRGTIFKLTLGGVETILQSLSDNDGLYPETGLLKVGRLLYGTTAGGGDNGYGTVFTVSHD